jgi:hypothetical protein
MEAPDISLVATKSRSWFRSNLTPADNKALWSDALLVGSLKERPYGVVDARCLVTQSRRQISLIDLLLLCSSGSSRLEPSVCVS